MEVEKVLVVLFFLNTFFIGAISHGETFNVMDYGAKGDGKSDDCKAFEDAWKAGCAATGSPKVVIPKGTYLVGPVKFFGPCKAASTITVQVEGTVLGSTNLGQYETQWIQFSWINGLILNGGGTFDGQGASAWPSNKCPTNRKCKLLPMSLHFHEIRNSTINGITSLNSKNFHFGIVDSSNLDIRGLTITAPGDSPNTDGIHLERTSDVTISDSNIGTGDDCISIGQGNSRLTISKVSCGPGHGISVGSLGKYPNEKDVTGLLVKDCTLTGTLFGLRIKTWENTPGPSTASNLTFEHITMKNVGNPIIIDQTYCPYASCSGASASKVKLKDVTFRDIKGTSATPEAVILECSAGQPCSNVILEDIQLNHVSGAATSKCTNAQAKFLGAQNPAPCM